MFNFINFNSQILLQFRTVSYTIVVYFVTISIFNTKDEKKTKADDWPNENQITDNLASKQFPWLSIGFFDSGDWIKLVCVSFGVHDVLTDALHWKTDEV